MSVTPPDLILYDGIWDSRGCDPAEASLASADLTGGIGTVFSLLFGLMLLRRRS